MKPSTTQPNHTINRGAWRSLSAIAVATPIFVLAGAPADAQSGPVANEIVELLPSDGHVADQFGAGVSISGDTAIIGAPFGDGNNMTEIGSAYVYVQETTGVWTRQAKLLASDAGVYQLFGCAVSISGDTAVVGALTGDGIVPNAGAAYIFVRDASGVWTQQAKLIASDGAQGDMFGYSAAISGDTAIIGANLDGDACPGNPNCNSGAAYIFTRDTAGVWTQQAKLLASDGLQDDQFGFSVALSGGAALVGAPALDSSSTGSAYVFMRDANGAWTQQTKLIASDGASKDQFGYSLAISGATAVIGAEGDDRNGPNTGSAYIFVRDAAGNWTQQTKLLSIDSMRGDRFGASVAINADTVVVGAIGVDDNGKYAGSAYVFGRDPNGDWSQRAKLLASDGLTNDLLGISVALRNDTAIVGSLGFSKGKAGAAYTFSLLSPADFNGDGLVSAADLALLLPQWGSTGSADLNNDGAVDAADLAILLANWS